MDHLYSEDEGKDLEHLAGGDRNAESMILRDTIMSGLLPSQGTIDKMTSAGRIALYSMFLCAGVAAVVYLPTTFGYEPFDYRFLSQESNTKPL